MITSSNNSSNILKRDASDIFEQIKKKAEDLSTSEGSIPLFQNLSNPTNLTNPQIISLRKHPAYVENLDDSKNKSKTKTRNIRLIKRVKSEISELHDEFLLSQQIKKLILQKEPKKVFDKPKKRAYDILKGVKTKEKDKKNKTIEPINKKNEDIWSRLKKIPYIPRDKKLIRVNKRKNISARDYITNTKEIQLMKYINKHKIERFNMLSNLKRTELDSITNTITSLENNKDFILNNYKEKYTSYVNYLNKRRDEEEKNNFNLYLTEEKIKREISQLQFRFNKKKKEKNFMINIILLFIQIKEKMTKISDNSILVLDYNLLDGQRRLMQRQKTNLNEFSQIVYNEDINKILKYKGKPIYNDVSEFDYDYHQIEDRVHNKFKQNEKIKLEIEQLKEEYNKLKIEGEYDPEAEDKKERIILINKLKDKNKELTEEIISLKVKFADEKHNILTKKKHVLKHSSSTLSLKRKSNINFDNINKNNNNFFNVSNTYYDNYTTLYGFKNIYTLSNFNFNKMRDVSDLYHSCYKLYKTAKDNLFDEIEINFTFENSMKSTKINEDLVIIKMLEYIDQVVTLLIIQKNRYLSENNLKKKYEKIKNLMERDKRRMRFINHFQEEEEKQRLKIQELELKKNIVPYIPSKKIENYYYFKARKDHLIKIKHLAELKKPPTFEDFLYDIMD